MCIMKMDYCAMGTRLRAVRRAHNMTQAALANEIGVASCFIGQIERGEKKPSVETVVALCDVLKVSMDYLLRGRINRCDQQNCELFESMKALLSMYGDC